MGEDNADVFKAKRYIQDTTEYQTHTYTTHIKQRHVLYFSHVLIVPNNHTTLPIL